MFLNQIKLIFFLCNILFISIIDFHVIRDVCGICIFILLINFFGLCVVKLTLILQFVIGLFVGCIIVPRCNLDASWNWI